ncbi:Arc family DNA-binding protein [Rhizobium leguminosarum]|uniref:Arc family DNA-binding protein n=1 Tax=Rhizobium leguminosarum TaxID=384 RepID=UPI001441FFA2|nr:Arc family DNA-binding protein [Rhizobium leguminosarum]
MRTNTQDAEKYVVRFPDGLRDRLREVAQENRRSMNAEIIFHLERALFDPLEMKKGGEVSA